MKNFAGLSEKEFQAFVAKLTISRDRLASAFNNMERRITYIEKQLKIQHPFGVVQEGKE